MNPVYDSDLIEVSPESIAEVITPSERKNTDFKKK